MALAWGARRLVAMGADDLDHNVGVHPMVFPAVFDDSNGIGFLPPVIDESIQLGCIVLPLLCLLQTLLVRLWRGCCAELPQAPSSRAASDGLPYSGELNDLEGRAGDYTEEQRLRDREEELRIKGRASRVTLSHV